MRDQDLAHLLGEAIRRALVAEHTPQCLADGRAGDKRRNCCDCTKQILEQAWREYCRLYPGEIF